MPRFLIGDELGNIKSLRCSGDNLELKTIHDGSHTGKGKCIQALSAASTSSGATLLAAAHADGYISASILQDDDHLEPLDQWKETRFNPDQRYVGLSVSERGIYSCTSNGASRMTTLGVNDAPISHKLASLPARLCDWRISSDQETFACGGDEVELSVWNTEQVFSPLKEQSAEIETSKRKRGDALFPGELWRAKNVPNDNLGLRQPVHITSLTYLWPSSSHYHLLTGTELGDVRRYDTRVRRPVADWKGIGKIGGVKKVEKGFAEHEVFVSDKGCNLLALDLRNGAVLCGYKGLSGAVTSIASSPTFVASAALDRFARVHSTSVLPQQAGQQVEKKGEVLDKVYTKSIPTIVIWDGDAANIGLNIDNADDGETDNEDDNVWETMQNVGDSDGEDAPQGAKRSVKKGRVE
ncbi:hypothetical protein PILCRDRAFT_815437 [Piloderma croceum F 1598]|uniref:Ribosome biogenesis protein NSA1 n=1 Tax=Piloderma croceum (strain F 1598) TaxID=765440 RepID=A0A0C3BKP2_PILCF|nr:hypothetical protein PILCRDRAFT_815437 [Piloderma croceum F 1598]